MKERSLFLRKIQQRFFIRYQVDGAARIGEEFKTTFQIGDIDGEIDGIVGAVRFILFIKVIKGGYLTMPEGYTNGVDKWPIFTKKRPSSIALPVELW